MRTPLIALVITAVALPVGAQPAPKPRTVVLVSIDGLRTDLAMKMPTLQAYANTGMSTTALTPLPAVTVVSHTAMFTGASPDKNGVAGFEPSRDEEAAWRPLKVATVFQALHAAHIPTAAFYQKVKLEGLMPTEDVTFSLNETKDASMVKEACREFGKPEDKNDPQAAFVFVHFRAIDSAGHKYGWMSKEQRAAAKSVDTSLATLTACALARPDVVVIYTSDHGGHGKTHGTADDTDQLVPWIAFGTRIEAGRKIRHYVRLVDTAPTVLRLLGLDPNELLPEAEGRAVPELFATH